MRVLQSMQRSSSRLQRAEALHQVQCRYSAISASASALPALRQDELREFLVINIHSTIEGGPVLPCPVGHDNPSLERCREIAKGVQDEGDSILVPFLQSRIEGSSLTYPTSSAPAPLLSLLLFLLFDYIRDGR